SHFPARPKWRYLRMRMFEVAFRCRIVAHALLRAASAIVPTPARGLVAGAWAGGETRLDPGRQRACATVGGGLRCVALALALVCAAIAPAQEDDLAAKSSAAKQAIVAGRYPEAIRIYRELVKAMPDNAGLRLNLGLALDKAGQPGAAIPELQT